METSEQRKIINPVNVKTWISNFSVLPIHNLSFPFQIQKKGSCIDCLHACRIALYLKNHELNNQTVHQNWICRLGSLQQRGKSNANNTWQGTLLNWGVLIGTHNAPSLSVILCSIRMDASYTLHLLCLFNVLDLFSYTAPWSSPPCWKIFDITLFLDFLEYV